MHLIPWHQGYQPLMSIDSVSGEIKSTSPFDLPKKPPQWEVSPENATNCQMYYRVITSQADYEDCRSFRARLEGTAGGAGSWGCNVTSSTSTLDKMRVNSKDIFAYFGLQFQRSCDMLSVNYLNNLKLSKEARMAASSGQFREQYGDMIIVGYITGGKAEAMIRVSRVAHSRRNDVKLALEASFQQGGSAGAAVEDDRSLSSALQGCSCSLLVVRSGLTDPKQKSNPTEWGRLIRVLELDATNQGERIAAVCYKMDTFKKVPRDILGFRTVVVEQNVRTLQKQFALVEFVRNCCDAVKEAADVENVTLQSGISHRIQELVAKATRAAELFLKYTSSHYVEKLDGKDTVCTIGEELMTEWDKLEKDIGRTVPEVIGHAPRPREAPVPGVPSTPGTPQVHSQVLLPRPSVECNPDTSVHLLVKVGGATNLPGGGMPGSAITAQDLYLKFTVQGQEFRTTVAKRSGARCDWNQEFPPIKLTAPWEKNALSFELKGDGLVQTMLNSKLLAVLAVPLSEVPRAALQGNTGLMSPRRHFEGAGHSGSGASASEGSQGVLSPTYAGIANMIGNAIRGAEEGDMASSDPSQMRPYTLLKPPEKAKGAQEVAVSRGTLTLYLQLRPIPPNP